MRTHALLAIGLLIVPSTHMTVAQQAPPGEPPAYTLGPGDLVHVAVLGQDEMTGDFRIEDDGTLRFPFLGRIPASGKSIEEFEAALVTLLADGYLKQPRVAVTVKEFVSLRVFVTGEVRKPGAYGLRPDRSLLALLDQIGELTETIGHEVVVIRPPGSETPGETDKAQITRLSLRDIRSGNPERDFRLSPGDTVFFPKAAQVYVTGQVAKPGAFRFEEGMTVYQALNLAGGINERGSSKVKIARIVDGQRTELKAKPGDLMLPEDTLIVPERFF